MTYLDQLRLILFVAFVFCLLSSDGAAQPQQLADLWQFPQLTNSKPFQRWWWAFQQRAYPLGEIPEGVELRALQETEQSKASLAFTSQPVAEGRWVNIGPAPILGGQIGKTGNTRPMSGRIGAVVVDPSDASHWLIGAAQGGVWETHDAGTTWTPKTDGQASLAMGAIAFAPSNPSIIYAGTGEASFGVSYAGAGLLKSTDGGTTWQLLSTSTFAKTTFSDIKVHPTSPNILLAATSYGLAGRGLSFPPFTPARGIFKSTDGGVSWLQKLPGDATDMEVDPGNFNRQYVGIGNLSGGPLNGVYRSTDAGETWTLMSGPWSVLPGGVGRVELAIAPSDPNVIYVSIQDAFDTVGNDGGLLGLWRTDNAFAATPTWIQIPTGATDDGTGIHGYCGWNLSYGKTSNQCSYNHEIIVDPANVSILYAGGIELWKCADCGSSPTWTEISKSVSSPATGIHADQHTMTWAGSRLIVGNDGGVWSTTNNGTTWSDHNTNLSITQFYDGSIHPTDTDFALGGSQDNGTEKWAGTDAWQWISGGDGADNAISSANPDTHWVVSAQFLEITRTTDGGVSFSAADTGITDNGDDGVNSRAPFIARFEKCPLNDDVFIAGTDNLWKSGNFFSAGSPSWSPNSPDMGFGNDGRVIQLTALAFAPSDAACNTYAFGTTHGQLRLTSNGGNTWVDIDVGNVVPDRYVTDLAFDPTNANILYVTLSGFDEGTPGQPGHVFKTINALTTFPDWSNESPPVNTPHNTIVLDPSNSNIVYVGTDLGVWKSIDGGNAWIHMGPEIGMPNVAVYELQINHTTSRLVAFTHGRGAFALLTTQSPTTIMATFESPETGPVSGVAVIRGWAFAMQPGVSISKVELFIDGVSAGDIPCCSDRADVQAAFPQFPAANTLNSGWGTTLNWGVLNAGTHSVQVVIHSSVGEQLATETRTVTVVKPGNSEFLDQFSLSGAIARIEGDQLVVEGAVVRDKASQQQKTINSRYRWFISSQSLQTVEAGTPGVAFSGQSFFSGMFTALSQWFLGLSGAPAAQASPGIVRSFESPEVNQIVAGVAVIRGWAFTDTAGASLTEVRLVIDGQPSSAIPCCSQRGDVAAAFPGNPNALNSGWGFTINYGNFPAGVHNLGIRVSDSVGATITDTHGVTVVKVGGFAFLDQFNLAGSSVQIQGEEIVLSGVQVRDKASQQTRVVTVRLRWLQSAQALGVVASAG